MKTIHKNFNLIIWGIILVIIDFDYSHITNEIGYKIDLINDFIGSLMICLGIVRIRRIPRLPYSYTSFLDIALIGAMIQIFFGILDFFIFEIPAWFSLLCSGLDLIVVVSMIYFCKAMILLSKKEKLVKSKERWTNSSKLLLWLNLIPLGLLTMIDLLMSTIRYAPYEWRSEWGFDSAIGLIIILIFTLTPILYCLYSMHRMKIDIKALNRSKYPFGSYFHY